MCTDPKCTSQKVKFKKPAKKINLSFIHSFSQSVSQSVSQSIMHERNQASKQAISVTVTVTVTVKSIKFAIYQYIVDYGGGGANGRLGLFVLIDANQV